MSYSYFKKQNIPVSFSAPITLLLGIVKFSSGPEQISDAFNGILSFLIYSSICMKNLSEIILFQFSVLLRILNEAPVVI